MQKWILEILAEKAYSAFHLYLDKTVSKVEVLSFQNISDEERRAWMNVCEEVITSYPCLEEKEKEGKEDIEQFRGDAES
jgi:hypothetical protein